MIPSTSGFLEEDLEEEIEPSYTYRMDFENNRVVGHTDEQKAMEQAIFKILSTERYQYIIYSWNYGIETIDLYGEPTDYVCAELERRITEALTQDDRIEDVTDFEFDDETKKGIVYVKFTVQTIFGGVDSEMEVKV